MKDNILSVETYLDTLFPNPRCELNYNKDYELLIAVMLSSQTTDKRVNMVTNVLFTKYDTLEKLRDAEVSEIEAIIKSIGTFRKKASNVKEIAKHLLEEQNGIVPNNRTYLESLPGVGHKTTNVVLSNLYEVPCIAVDTHVERVSKRLSLANESDSVAEVERKLMKKFPKERWSRTHHQLVLFGRYYCKSMKPECSTCPLKSYCKVGKKLLITK